MPGFFSNLLNSFKVDIRCDLSRNVFFPGNVVEGVVIVSARSPIDFRAIRLKLVGKEHVTIARNHTTQHRHADGRVESRTHTEYHHSTAVVYKQLITLAGNMKFNQYGNGSSTYPMPGGTFFYPFSVQLPNDLPPSVSRRVGNNRTEIFFFAKAYVDIPLGRDAVSKSFFTVLRPIPISQWGHKHPVSSDRNFHVTCCCCIDKGYVKARIYMDRTVIAIDRDNLMVFADIDNTLGKEPVRALNVSLRAVMNSHAGGHREVNSWQQSSATIRNEIPAGGRGIIQGVVQLNRKAIPTYNAPHSNLTYSVVAELEIPMASNPVETFPVVVAQSVDESNFAPPVQFGSCTYTVFPKHGPCPEFYYQPPQQPVYQVNMIPLAPPPQQFLLPPPVMVSVGLPGSAWLQEAAPIVPLGVKEHHVQPALGSPIHYQAGFAQREMTISSATKESSPLPPHSPQSPSAKGYGSVEEPLL